MRSPAEVFAEHCARGELAYQVDPGGRALFYPRVGDELEWRVSAGRGTVYATTVVRRRGEDPYDVSIVELDEGFRMMSRVVGVPPEDVTVGMRVAVRFEERDDGHPVPVFEAAA